MQIEEVPNEQMRRLERRIEDMRIAEDRRDAELNGIPLVFVSFSSFISASPLTADPGSRWAYSPPRSPPPSSSINPNSDQTLAMKPLLSCVSSSTISITPLSGAKSPHFQAGRAPQLLSSSPK